MANELHMCRSEWVYCNGDCGSCQRANYAATNRTGGVSDGKTLQILYLCDHRRCENCMPPCCHTTDISHAKNFEAFGSTYREKEAAKIKRVTIETAGPYVDVIVYPIAKGRPTKTERSQARHYTSEVRQKMNDRTAAQKFKRLIAANFTNQDLVVALTYHDAALPPTPEQAREKKLRPFIRDLRAAFRENGEELKYMYVTEGLHGDHRLHHHIILPNVPGLKGIVRELWKKNGENIGFDRLGSKGIDEWAGYLTKEPRKTGRRRLGDRMWTPSLGLKKPEVISYEVPDNYVYTPPDGVVITTNEEMRTEYVSVQYISYRIPEN